MPETTPEKKQSLVPRLVRGSSRAGVGGGALLIGIALFLLFKGFGFGPGGGGGEGGEPENENETVGTNSTTVLAASADATSDEEKRSLLVPDEAAGGLTVDEEKALSGNVLTILIDEHDYLMQIPGTTDSVYRPVPKTRLMELAKLTTGDTNGIRVRVLRRESARASAEIQLKADLIHAGLKEDAIVMPRDFVP